MRFPPKRRKGLAHPRFRERSRMAVRGLRPRGHVERDAVDLRDACGEARGQSSVEAGLLLPSLLVVFAILLEPICILYTRSVMAATASELCRILVTKRGDITDAQLRAFALRRLSAVPETTPFHGGGEDDWTIATSGAEGDAEVAVTIEGHVPLLPLFSFVARALGVAGEEGVALSVTSTEVLRPEWLEGGYDDWVSMWDS